ncbi:hypothetical protein B296_00052259 [Ensete ventricosum]|uniref:Glutathione S-transferase n=1 Tax=Ensete ventricosum TaxID=4639 RepID=A0A426X283_ENSVE|nr:hypothetical protein B296_00052259 [Ensete ventricosum]
MAEEVKLLGRRLSPFSTRVRIALNLKEVAHEFVTVEIFGQKSEILLKSNPVYKKIPVLLHHGNPICESMVILHYIDDCSQGKNFFGGDAIGYLDIALGSYLGPLKAGEKLSNMELLDEKKVPLLAGWAERFSKHDAVREVLAGAEEYIEMIQSMADGVPTV